MADKLKWDSNNGQVADRELAIARVRGGALEICTDEKTGRFVGVHLEKEAPLYDFSFTPPYEPEFIMTNGILESVNNRLIPFPYPLGLANGEPMPRMYDFVVGGVTYTFDPDTQADITFVSGDFTVTVGFWGYVLPVYDIADAANMPASGQSITLLTITQFRVSNLDGSIISPAFTNSGNGFDVIITGEASGTDTTAPTVLSVTPVGIDVVLDQDITITCSEYVQAGTGNFYIWDTIADSALETIAAASGSYEGDRIVLTRSNSEAHSNSYDIRWDAGTFEDLAGNPVAAETGGTYSWITEAVGGGGGGTLPPAITPDAVVSSIAALESLMASWAGTSNWNATAAGLGLTAADPRTIGYDAALTGNIDLSNMVFPQLVTIRAIGTFGSNFSTSVPVTGAISMAGSSNIRWYLSELRAPAGTNPTGWVNINNASYIYFDRVVARGTPYTYSAGNRPTTYCFIYATANTDHIYFKNFVHRYLDAATINWHNGVHTNWDIDGWMGEYHGGDDIGDISFYQSAVGTLDGLTTRGLFGDRTRSKLYGKHTDGWQSFQAPAKITNFNASYCVFLHGEFLPTGEIAGTGWQTIFISSGASDPGSSSVDQMLFCGGHARGTDKPNGNTMNVTNATFLFGPYTQAWSYGNAPFPGPYGSRGAGAPANYNTGWSISNCYQVVNGLGKANVIKAGNGNVIRVVPGTGISTWNFSAVSPDVENLPTEFKSLWEVRPKAGGALDPGGQACGCYDLWNKLYAGDPIVCKSVVGWPVAEMFINRFDPGNNFAGGNSGYTGNYDGDGNNN